MLENDSHHSITAGSLPRILELILICYKVIIDE